MSSVQTIVGRPTCSVVTLLSCVTTLALLRRVVKPLSKVDTHSRPTPHPVCSRCVPGLDRQAARLGCQREVDVRTGAIAVIA